MLLSDFASRLFPLVDLRPRTPAQLPRSRFKRLDNGSDVAVLENRASAPPRSAYDGIHHGAGQVVGTNHLVGKQSPKRGVGRSQQAIAEIRLLPRLNRVDISGPEDIN